MRWAQRRQRSREDGGPGKRGKAWTQKDVHALEDALLEHGVGDGDRLRTLARS